MMRAEIDGKPETPPTQARDDLIHPIASQLRRGTRGGHPSDPPIAARAGIVPDGVQESGGVMIG